jgi:hypothetical protein
MGFELLANLEKRRPETPANGELVNVRLAQIAVRKRLDIDVDGGKLPKEQPPPPLGREILTVQDLRAPGKREAIIGL